MANDLLLELLKRAVTPLIPQIQQGFDAMADNVDDPQGGSDNVPLEMLRGFQAGTMQGVGNVLSDLTSPVGVASTALGYAATPSKSALGRLLSKHKVRVAPDPERVIETWRNLPEEFWPVGSEPPTHWSGGPKVGSEALKPLPILESLKGRLF